jgi:hypothetical protein
MFLEYAILDRKSPENTLPVDSDFQCLTYDRLLDAMPVSAFKASPAELFRRLSALSHNEDAEHEGRKC